VNCSRGATRAYARALLGRGTSAVPTSAAKLTTELQELTSVHEPSDRMLGGFAPLMSCAERTPELGDTELRGAAMSWVPIRAAAARARSRL
jgi:hypothetical protein